MLISERIYSYLEEKKISQKEFAERTGISQSTVSDWRRKGTNPSADKIMIICEVLGVSPYELLLGTDNKMQRKHNEPDYVIFQRDSRESVLIEKYQHLENDAKRRLEGYLEALSDMQKSEGEEI